MSPIFDGQAVDAAVTNPVFLDKTQDDATVGKVGLHAPNSPFVDDAQTQLNGLSEFTGCPQPSTSGELPSWIHNDVGASGDSLFDRSDLLTFRFSGTAGHGHSGADGDGPQLEGDSIGGVALHGFIFQGTDITGVTGISSDVTSLMTGKTASSSDTSLGVVTNTPYNKVIIRHATGVDTDDSYFDASGNLVYGRLTASGGNWTLGYYINDSGTEDTYSFGTASDIRWYYQELFNPISSSLPPPVYSEFAFTPSDNATADVLTATSGMQGKVQLGSATPQAVGSAAIGTFNGNVSNADHAHEGVHSLAASGSSGLVGDAVLVAGSNVSLTQVGQDITISSIGGGSGTGLNYLDTATSTTNSDFEKGIGDWVAFKDTAGTSPTDGTGGTPTVVSIAQTLTGPLFGSASALISHTAANGQGEGVSVDFTIDKGSLATAMTISFSYILNSGTFQAGSDGSSAQDSDIEVWIYDVTNAVLIQPAPFKLYSNSSTIPSVFTGEFQSSSNSTSYRLILFNPTTGTSAWGLMIDDVQVGPNTATFGSPVTDWKDYTPTTQGLGTITIAQSRWRRVGDSMEIQARTSLGTTTAVQAQWGLPSGYSIFSPFTQAVVGRGDAQVSNLDLTVLAGASNTYLLFGNAGSAPLSAINGSSLTSSEVLSFFAKVPIQGWSSNVAMSSDAGTSAIGLDYSLSATQTISGGGTYQTVTNFGTKNTDTLGMMNTSTGVITFQRAGDYRISHNIGFALESASSIQYNSRWKIVNSSGTVFINGDLFTSQSIATYPILKNTRVYHFNAGDTLEVQVAENNAGTRTVSNTATDTSISVELISGSQTLAANDTVSALAKASTTTAITGTIAQIQYATVSIDKTGSFSSNQFTAPISGLYEIDVLGLLNVTAFTTAGRVDMSVWAGPSAATEIAASTSPMITKVDFFPLTPIHTEVQLNAGDTVVVKAQISEGSFTCNTHNDTNYTQFKITRVGN